VSQALLSWNRDGNRTTPDSYGHGTPTTCLLRSARWAQSSDETSS
jgi:hypothetical protein